jgi:hypothetical protein
MLWITLRPAVAADPINGELTRETQHLVDLIREGAEETQVTSSPIMVTTNCNQQRQWWYERCETDEALVPFTTSGPGSGVWDYVALFRVLPLETALESETQREPHRKPKRVSLVTFAFIPQPLGLIDWKTAKVEAGHVLVQTRHWTRGDGHANPTGRGVVRIELDGGLKLMNLP